MLLSLLLLACGKDKSDTGADATDAVRMPVCLSSFSADVRSGPDAGLHLAGVLAMVDAGDPDASFFLGDSASLDVPMTLSGEDVTLDFALEAGTVHGTGTMPFGIDSCDGEMVGPLTGPAEGDAGDWAGTSSIQVPWPEGKSPAIDDVPSCMFQVASADGSLDGVVVIGSDSDDTVTGLWLPGDNALPLALAGTNPASPAITLYDASGASRSGALSLSGSWDTCEGTLTGDIGGVAITGRDAPLTSGDTAASTFLLNTGEITLDESLILEISVVPLDISDTLRFNLCKSIIQNVGRC